MKKEKIIKAWGLYEEELLIVEPYFTKEKMKLTYEHEIEDLEWKLIRCRVTFIKPN